MVGRGGECGIFILSRFIPIPIPILRLLSCSPMLRRKLRDSFGIIAKLTMGIILMWRAVRAAGARSRQLRPLLRLQCPLRRQVLRLNIDRKGK